MVKTRKDENGNPLKAYERGYHVGFQAQLDVSRRQQLRGACGRLRAAALRGSLQQRATAQRGGGWQGCACCCRSLLYRS